MLYQLSYLRPAAGQRASHALVTHVATRNHPPANHWLRTPMKPPAAETPAAARTPGALTVAYLACAAALIALRALVRELEFLSIGWLLLLAAVPLLPWLIPALKPLAAYLAPFIKSVKLPLGLEISLNSAASPVAGLGMVESVLTSDHLVHGLPGSPAPFTTTDAMSVIQGVQAVRQSRAEAVTVDLGSGRKWRLPNLYFLSWLLANDPIVGWMVFIEERSGMSGVFVGVCAANVLKLRIEAVYPQYASVAPQLVFHDPSRVGEEQALADEFNKIRGAVAPAVAGELPTLAWLTAAGVHELLGPHLVTKSISWTEHLDREGLDVVISAPIPYVAATTADGRFGGLIDQREVALAFARRALHVN